MAMQFVKKATQEVESRGWKCAAYDCPFPGSIDGVCRHHFSAEGGRWRLISERLSGEYRALTNEVLAGRKRYSRQDAIDEKQEMKEGWIRMSALGYDLDPQNCVVRGDKRMPAKNYKMWLGAAEDLLSRLVRAE